MVTLGVDAHKQMHVAVAVDELGRPLGQWEGPNTPEAWQEALAWASEWESRQWGIEGTGNYGRGLAQHLVAEGETVFEVNPRLTAQSRRRARNQDKSDRLDAQAVARVVLREGTGLPRVIAEDQAGEARLLDALCRERKQITAQRIRMRSQLHHALFQLDPQYKRAFPRLTQLKTVEALVSYAPDAATPLQCAQAAAVRHLAQMLRIEAVRHRELTRQIEAIAKAAYPALIELPGVGPLTAGMLAGIMGTHAFRSDTQLAAYGGTAPLETSSAGHVRHRVNRGGNRRLNSILYMMALGQWNSRGTGRSYITRKMAEGRSWLEAVRALKRFISRAVWQVWQHYYCPKPVHSPLSLT